MVSMRSCETEKAADGKVFEVIRVRMEVAVKTSSSSEFEAM
jgi:hypothetical protein